MNSKRFWNGFAAVMTRLTGKRWVNPTWADDTATCAAGCGTQVALGKPHYTVVRSAERVEADGTVQPLDSDELAFVHVSCWPGERVTLRAILGGPDQGRLTESPAGA